MRNFPIFLNMEDARVVIVGGGEQAAQKLRLIGRSAAHVVVMTENLDAELSMAVSEGRVDHHVAVLDPMAFQGARMVIVATGCAALDAAAADLARAAGAIVNVVDRPGISDFITPAIVDRDPVVVAIGTEGTAPVLARQIKTAVEAMLEPGLGRFAALAGRLRSRVAHRIAPKDRRRFWEWAMGGPRRLAGTGHPVDAEREINRVLDTGEVPGVGPRPVAIIDAVSDADLLSLRAVGRLQSADLILHQAGGVDPILELARRDAERAPLSTDPGPVQWQMERDARQAGATAAAGRLVVWIGNSADASKVLGAAGVRHEILPVAKAGPAIEPSALPVVARPKER